MSIQYSLTKAKAPKSRNGFVLSADIVDSAEGKQRAFSLVAKLLGIEEERQIVALRYLLANLENNLYLGTLKDFSKGSTVSKASCSKMLSALAEFNLVEVNIGYTRVSPELVNLFSFDSSNGDIQLTFHFNLLPDQMKLDI